MEVIIPLIIGIYLLIISRIRTKNSNKTARKIFPIIGSIFIIIAIIIGIINYLL
jgi:cytochrome c oxidase assembly factor CtaG